MKKIRDGAEGTHLHGELKVQRAQQQEGDNRGMGGKLAMGP